MAGARALIGAASVALPGCCNDVTTSTCFDWDEPTTCPSRDVAASTLAVSVDDVTSAGTFWPAHDYLIGGEHDHVPSACCYDVVSSVCTTELH